MATRILAIDSSTEACSVALRMADGETLEHFELAARSHTQRLLPMVDALLAQAGVSLGQLDAIAVAVGPGSFTGLRIGIAAAQGLAYGADLPAVPVSTLAALAQTARQQGLVADDATVLSLIDARMDEIYWARFAFADNLAQAQGDEQLCAPEALVLGHSQTIAAVGSGLHYGARIGCHQQLSALDAGLLPRASAVAALAAARFARAELCAPDQLQASYLRDQVAWKKLSEQ